jgi:hypothetical protein
MTIALRGIVDIYRKANRSSEVHRRALGFSISRDDNSARVYAHYPEIDGDSTTYWRETIKELNFGDGKGKDRFVIQSLQRQLEQQRQDSLAKLRQQKQESEQQREMLTAQLEQQRKDSGEQQKELVQLLKQQSEQIRALTLQR